MASYPIGSGLSSAGRAIRQTSDNEYYVNFCIESGRAGRRNRNRMSQVHFMRALAAEVLGPGRVFSLAIRTEIAMMTLVARAAVRKQPEGSPSRETSLQALEAKRSWSPKADSLRVSVTSAGLAESP